MTVTKRTENGYMAAVQQDVDNERSYSIPDPPAPKPEGPSLRGRRKEKWVIVHAEDYPGFAIKIWVNHPRYLAQDFRHIDATIQKTALNKVILEHNGWLDEEDKLIPQPNQELEPGEPDFWDVIPDELAALLFSLITLESSELSFSTVAERRNIRRISGQR